MIKRGFNKKGISPVIATVLLIAIVVIIGLIIFLWFRGMVQEAVTKFDENIELVCNDVNFDATYLSGVLSVSNTGNVPIYSMKAVIFESGSHTTEDLIDLASDWPVVGLNQGDAFSESIGFGNANKITLIPVLFGSSSMGEEPFVCNEKQHGYEIDI